MTDAALSDHRVLYVDPDWLDDPDAHGVEDVDTDDQPDFGSGVHAVAASSDLSRFALTTSSQGNSESGQACFFDVASSAWHWRELDEGRPFIGDGEQIAFSPDGSLVAVATSTDMKAIVWRTADMSMAWSAEPGPAWGHVPRRGQTEDVRPTGLFTHIAFSGDGRSVVATGGSPWTPEPIETPTERIVVAEASTGEVVYAADVPIRGGAILDQTGETLAHIGLDDEIVVQDLPSGAVAHRHPSEVPGARVLAYSPDAGAVAVGGDGVVQVVQLRDGASPGIQLGEGTTCTAMHWSPNGLRILVEDDEHATVLDADNHTLWTRPKDHLAAAFTPDGRTLVTVHDDTWVRAWSLTPRRRP
ncbi:WD40 repeat domain-containing protein [Spirillospora sp. NPDC052269]